MVAQRGGKSVVVGDNPYSVSHLGELGSKYVGRNKKQISVPRCRPRKPLLLIGKIDRASFEVYEFKHMNLWGHFIFLLGHFMFIS